MAWNPARTFPLKRNRRSIERIKAVRHPFLLSMERVEQFGRELIVVLELADHNLAAVLAEEQQAGQAGIPRERLLGYLREAAEALDFMNLQHNLQHMDVKPQNLFLVGNHVKVGDFGRVHSFDMGKADQSAPLHQGALTPVYAAPELFQNVLSRHSDQYSLAIVYQELLTGTRPFTGKNGRQFMMQHLAGAPDLGPLPAADRVAVARALSKTPADRFPTCSDFIHALVAGQTEVVTVVAAPSASVAPTVPREEPVPDAPEPDAVAPPDISGETLDDLRLLECLRRTPLTEVHRAQRADGSERLVQVLFGCAGKVEDLGPRLAELHSPALTPAKVVRDARGGVSLITAPAGRPLRDRFQECLTARLPGIPRAELLSCVRAAAAALDFLHQRHSIAHLGLNPRNLRQDEGRLQIADFGLAHLLWVPAGHNVAKLNVRYSAPELFSGKAGPACDQYSLALIYHEMLTGVLPAFSETRNESGTVSRQPFFERLPETDRAAVARALDPDPARRWSSCGEMVRALENPRLERSAEPAPIPAAVPAPAPISEPAAAGGLLQTWFTTLLTPEKIQARLDGFRQQWQGTTVLADAGDIVYRMPTPRSFWQRWTGKQPGLEVRVRLSSTSSPAGTATRVEVEVAPHDCGQEQAGELLGGIAPLLVESVRTFLQVNLHRRAQERLPWRHPLSVSSISFDGTVGPPIECQGKDISLGGISFYLPGEPPTAKLSLRLPKTAQTPAATVLARVVRIQDCGEGWYEVGARLLNTEEAPAAG